MLNLCETKKKFKVLLNNTEVLFSRAVVVVQRKAFTLDEQRDLAKTWNMCAKEQDGRICGRRVEERSIGVRNKCRQCKPIVNVCTEEEFHRKVHVPPPSVVERCITKAKTTHDNLVKQTVSVGCQGESPKMVSVGCQWDPQGSVTMLDVLNDLWDPKVVKPTTYANNKNQLTILAVKIFELGLHLDQCGKTEFREALSGSIFYELMKKISAGKNIPGVLSTAMKLCGYFSLPKLYRLFYVEKIRLNERCAPIKPKRRSQIETVAKTVEVDLEQDCPGPALLKAMRTRALELKPETESQFASAINNLLWLYCPAQRGKGDKFRWARKMPDMDDFSAHKKNLFVIKRGKVVGLLLAELKMNDSNLYDKNTKVYLDASGIWTEEKSEPTVPCHMSDEEWKLVMGRILEHANGVFALRGKPKSGRRVFSSKVYLNQMNEQVWGVKIGAQIMRIIFRNGLECAPDAFVYKYVLQHTAKTDVISYLKTELSNGPWKKPEEVSKCETSN